MRVYYFGGLDPYYYVKTAKGYLPLSLADYDRAKRAKADGTLEVVRIGD